MVHVHDDEEKNSHVVDGRLRFDAAGTRLTDQEISTRYGSEVLRYLLIFEEADKLQSPLDAIYYPPRLFVSYRWSEENHAIVKTIAKQLKRAGWDVLFDEQQMRSENEVAAFVAQIQTCRVFVCLWTEGYARETEEGTRAQWLFDEWNHAGHLASRFRCIRIVNLFLGGDRKPRGHDLIDLRSLTVDEMGRAITDKLSYDGATLSDNEALFARDSLNYAIQFVREERLDEGLIRLNDILSKFPFIRAAHWYKCLVLHAKSEWRDLVAASGQALENLSPIDALDAFREMLVRGLQMDAEFVDAVRIGCQFLKENVALWRVRHIVATLLFYQGEAWAGVNHLMVVQAHASTDLTEDLSRFGSYHGLPPKSSDETAEQYLTKVALASDPHSDSEMIRCNSCGSRYPLTAKYRFLCGLCGSSRPALNSFSPCGYCGHHGFIPFIEGSVICPICRGGTLRCT